MPQQLFYDRRDTSSSFFLLNRAEISTPSFLPSLKVLLRHRN